MAEGGRRLTIWAVVSVLAGLDVGTVVAVWRLRRRVKVLEAEVWKG